MSDSDIGFNVKAFNQQWNVGQEQQQQEIQQMVKQQIIKDQLVKAEVTQATVQTDYVNNANFPKLVDPPAHIKEGQQQDFEGQKIDNPAGKEQLIGRAAVLTSKLTERPGETRTPVTTLTNGNPLIDPKSANQFAEKAGVTPGAVYLANAFSQANPGQPLEGAFAQLSQSLQQQSVYDNDNKEVADSQFSELLDQSEGDVQQLANKLGVTPQKAREMIMNARQSGGRDPNPEVNEFAGRLGEQASANAEKAIQDQTFNRYVFSAPNQIKQLAQQLGTTPEQAQSMIFQARDNPEAPVPNEVKQFASQLNAYANSQRSQEPKVDTEGTLNALVNASDGKNADKISDLANKLGMTKEEVKELLLKSAQDPSADVPPSVARFAEKLMQKAEKQAFENALDSVAANIFDANIAAGKGNVAKLAKMLNIPLNQAKLLLQQAAVDPKSVPDFLADMAGEMKEQSALQAFARLQDLPSGPSVMKALTKHIDDLYEEHATAFLFKGSSLEGNGPAKVLFARQHPELHGQLDPDAVAMSNELENLAKNKYFEEFGIPKSFKPNALARASDDIGSQTYDQFFEAEIARLRSNGEINEQEVAQLRQQHYQPDMGFPASKAIQERFQQIENTILPQVQQFLGAPSSYKPKPGNDLFAATMSGAVGDEAEQAIDQLVENGTISKGQGEQIKELMAGTTDKTPEELQAIIASILNASIQKVANKYNIDPSAIDGDMVLSTGANAANLSKLTRNGINMASEAQEMFKKTIDGVPPGSAMRPVYAEFIKITRDALQTVKEYYFSQTSGDAKRAKNEATIELTKQMNKLDQMKRAFIERDEALEKAAAMKIFMIFLMLIMAVIMAILTVVMMPNIIGVIIAVITFILEVINTILYAVDSPASEAFSKFVMIFEIVVQTIMMLPAIIAAIVQAIAKIVAMVAQLLVQIVQMLLKLITKLVTLAIQEIIKMLLEMIKMVLQAVVQIIMIVLQLIVQIVVTLVKNIVNVVKDVVKSVVKAIEAVMDALVKAITDVIKAISQMATQIAEKGIGSVGKSFMNKLKNIGKTVMDALKHMPAKVKDVAKEAWDSVMEMGKEFMDGLKSMIKKPDGSLNWGVSDYMDMAKGTGSIAGDTTKAAKTGIKTEKLQIIAGGGAALTEGGQQIVQGVIQKAQAESQAAIIKLDAFLEEANEMIRFVRKFINKLLESMQKSVDWVIDISKEQGKFWSSMSKMSTGLAQSLQG